MTNLVKKGDISLSVIDCELDKLEAILRTKNYPRPFIGLMYRWSDMTNSRHAVRVQTTSIASAKYFTDNSVTGAIAKANLFIDELPDFLTAEQYQRHEEIKQLKAKARELGFQLVEDDQQETEAT